LLQGFPLNKNPDEETPKKDVIEPVPAKPGWAGFPAEQQADRYNSLDYAFFQ
jgi:hypothetical protein